MLEKSLSQPVNSYPSIVGAFGAFADAPSFTTSVFKIFPSLSLNITVYSFINSSYIAV